VFGLEYNPNVLHGGINNTDTWTGDGGTKMFVATGNPILADSEKVYVNEILMTRDVHYQILYEPGLINFMTAPGDGAEVKATYFYDGVVNGDLITTDKHPDAKFKAGDFNNTLGKLWQTNAFFYYTEKPIPTTSGPGILANVTFTVVGTGDSDITLVESETKLTGYNAITEEFYEIVSDWKPNIGHILHGYFTNVPVEVGWINGTVTDDSLVPLVGATVSANGVSNVTDASGFYSLEVSPGTYDVTAEMTGYVSQTVSVTVSADVTVIQDFALSLTPPEVGWINGTVTDADSGLPIAGASITADGYSTVTNASGNYELEVEPGTYTVTASLAGYESSQTDVTVAAGETITVDFELRPTPLTIDTLIMLVEDFIDEGEIEAKMQNSLLKKLYVAKRKMDIGKTKTSKNILKSFINHLEAQSGKHVSEEAANTLIAEAKKLRNSL